MSYVASQGEEDLSYREVIWGEYGEALVNSRPGLEVLIIGSPSKEERWPSAQWE